MFYLQRMIECCELSEGSWYRLVATSEVMQAWTSFRPALCEDLVDRCTLTLLAPTAGDLSNRNNHTRAFQFLPALKGTTRYSVHFVVHTGRLVPH